MEYIKPKILLLLLIGLITIDVLGFVIIEKADLLSAFYMTIITLSTVGFSEVIELSEIGRLWTIFVIISGFMGVVYAFRTLTIYFFDIQRIRKKSMEKKISRLTNHFIICGHGRVGRVICDNLHSLKHPFVVIENDEQKIAKIEEKGYLYLKGDATLDELQLAARIETARGIVCVLSTDADNLLATVTARALNQQIFILTRAIFRRSEFKLKKAGANRVINPYEISGHKMTRILMTPFVDDFFEIVSKKKKLDLGIEEIRVYSSSSIAGKSLREAHIRSDFNVIITAVTGINGDMEFNPSPDRKIGVNDTLIALGASKDLNKLRAACSGEKQ